MGAGRQISPGPAALSAVLQLITAAQPAVGRIFGCRRFDTLACCGLSAFPLKLCLLLGYAVLPATVSAACNEQQGDQGSSVTKLALLGQSWPYQASVQTCWACSASVDLCCTEGYARDFSTCMHGMHIDSH